MNPAHRNLIFSADYYMKKMIEKEIEQFELPLDMENNEVKELKERKKKMSSIGSNPPTYIPPYNPPKEPEKTKEEEEKVPEVIEGWPPHVHFGD